MGLQHYDSITLSLCSSLSLWLWFLTWRIRFCILVQKVTHEHYSTKLVIGWKEHGEREAQEETEIAKSGVQGCKSCSDILRGGRLTHKTACAEYIWRRHLVGVSHVQGDRVWALRRSVKPPMDSCPWAGQEAVGGGIGRQRSAQTPP